MTTETSSLNKYLEQPLVGIESPDTNDVPMGRGGFVNSHPGHKQYMRMVRDRKLEYVSCEKSEKINIAWGIVKDLRSLDPPARFLRKDTSTGLWYDVGDKKFREKVSQALREHQPFLKAVIDLELEDPSSTIVEPTRTGKLDSFQKLETILEQRRRSWGTAVPIYDSDQLRRTFAGSRIEPNAALGGIENLEPREERCLNLSEFSVSGGPFFLDSSLPASIGDCTSQDGRSFRRSPSNPFCGTMAVQPDQGTPDRPLDQPGPDIPKRGSSHGNETPETKLGFLGGSVKRCLLNRDKSDIARKLKESCTAERPALLSPDLNEMGSGTILDALSNTFLFDSAGDFPEV